MMRHLVLATGLVGVMTLPASAQTSNAVQAGKQLYASKECDRCHMVGGKGYKGGKLDGVASKVNASEMRQWLKTPADMEAKLDKKPKVRMSSRKGMNLTDADVTALVAYLMTLK